MSLRVRCALHPIVLQHFLRDVRPGHQIGEPVPARLRLGIDLSIPVQVHVAGRRGRDHFAGFGFATKHAVHRLVGIALFGVALLKLGLWDIWELETLHKIAVGGAIAALLLGSGFLYARFGARIKTLLAEGEKLPLWLVALLLLPATARATEPERYAQERPIRGVTEPGDYRFDVDVALYGASLSDLADIRLAGPHGAEVPFVLRRVWTRPRYGHQGRVLNPVKLPDASTRALLDFGRDTPEHDHHERQ